MEPSPRTPSTVPHPPGLPGSSSALDVADLLEKARADADTILKQLHSRLGGLTEAEAETSWKQIGPNEIARQKRQSGLMRLLGNVKNPLVLLLAALGILSFLTGDQRATVVIFVMVVLGVVLRFFQELRADHAAAKLQAMVGNTATAVRDGKDQEVPLKMLVPGDIIRLAAGDMVPADVRVLSAKDLFLNQATLTGEALPMEKKAAAPVADTRNPLELGNLCFLGSNVESGSATAVVIHTGNRTYFGSLAAGIAGQRVLTSFDLGINKFTWLMIQFIAVMVPAVFLINGFFRHNWLDAFLFAMAVAVGLTPEMLPMIVTVNLSKGALAMSRKKVIVKRLNAIQNFGAMDVLCTDKTGTLTQGKIVLEKHLDVNGDPNEKVLHYGYLNSYHHTGLKNLLDEAVLDHEELEERLKAKDKYRKIDEIPFDFVRRRMSVVVEDDAGMHTLICKGAVDEVLSQCTRVDVKGQVSPVEVEHDTKRRQIADDLNGQGFRVIAVAYKEMPGASDDPVYSVKDESDLILLGFLAFLDPPKDTASEALKRLHGLNVQVKVLTGDNEIITAHICKEVGMAVEHLLLGSQIEAMSDPQLATAANATSVFARLAPAQKAHHSSAAEPGPCAGVPGRRNQRRPGLEGCRCGHFGGQRRGHREGIIRHHPAGKQPTGSGAGRAGGPAGVRQHREVHQDGGQLELRQHVQCGRRQCIPTLPTHAADSGPKHQPSL